MHRLWEQLSEFRIDIKAPKLNDLVILRHVREFMFNHMVITIFYTKLLYKASIPWECNISVICTVFNQSDADYTFLHWYECKKCNRDLIGYCRSGFYAQT